MRKCPYCDFNSHALRGDVPESAYIDALLRDLTFDLDQHPDLPQRPIRSIFMGGGTPSLFSGRALGGLLAALSQRLSFADDIEITLEANPGTIDEAHFADYRAAGINRLSIGVQSFDDAKLQLLGRVHDAAQASAAIAEAAQAFETFNIDLMYALPGQTLEQLDLELNHALAFNPPHLSVYHLTIEPNTRFAKAPPANLPDSDLASEMLDLITARSSATTRWA